MLLPGESHGQRSLLGYSPWGIKVSIILSHFTAEDRTWKGSANCSSLQSWWMAELWFQTQLYNSREPPIPSPFQFSSVTQSCVTLCDPWTATHQASLSITYSRSLLKLMSIELVMSSNHLILCHPLLSCLQSFKESALHIRWPKYWSLSFSISPSNEYSGLISFTMDWLDLLAVQGTLKCLLQHHSSKAQYFSIQLSLWSNSHIHTWLLERP